ncbi:hypothetical protein ACN4EK_10985 [Pantanalinema rosaneae CENA516]|uniref:hypothetical protein n=1 Tax=Pantanalinema rosaneae TaxID=1620701 RepID=UPI003D7020FE
MPNDVALQETKWLNLRLTRVHSRMASFSQLFFLDLQVDLIAILRDSLYWQPQGDS